VSRFRSSHEFAARSDANFGFAALGLLPLTRRPGVDRERVHAARKLACKRLVDHAMAFDPALSAERLSYDMNPEMGLPAGPRTGVARVLMRLVDHVECLRRESRR
jgi:hypothetical protein